MKAVKWIALGLLIALIISGAALQPVSHRETQYFFDTVITLTVYGRQGKQAAAAAMERIGELDRLLSAYREDSDIGRINRAPHGTPVTVSEETYRLIARALEFSAMTDGLFDVTLKPVSDLWGIGTEHARVPEDAEIADALLKIGWEAVRLSENPFTVTLEKEGMALDLGGIAKGYAADEAARVLREQGAENACLDLGGNVVVMGEMPLGLTDSIASRRRSRPFTIGIQEPDAARGVAAEQFEMDDGCVVTSGDYERYFEQDGMRYHHIFDPRTGRPADGGVRSATVIGKDAAAADALSTVFFILGNDADGKWQDYYDRTVFLQ